MATVDNTTDNEIVPIPDFPGYFVSDSGDIYSKRPFKRSKSFRVVAIKLRQQTQGNGYKSVNLQVNRKRVTVHVHFLVLRTFVGPRPEGCQACHGPNGKTDNSVANLRWDTPSANAWDKERDGTLNKGETHGMSKLTADAVKQIRALHSQGIQGVVLARQFHVTSATISNVTLRQTWQHV